MTREAGDALTYVTIVCRRDLAILELQVRSVATFGASMQSARCLVIANGTDLSLAREVKAAVDRVPATPGFRFDVLPFSAVVPELDRTWGWRSQQILKLEAGRAAERRRPGRQRPPSSSRETTRAVKSTMGTIRA